MRIAVVTPCRDRLASLRRCLHSISRAAGTLDPVEHRVRTVVVNDRSQAGFAAALAREHSWIEVIDSDGAGPGAARNTGLRHAEADLYLLTDSDCVVADDVLQRAIDWYDTRSAPMGQGLPWLHQKSLNPALGAAEERLYAHMFSAYVDGTHTTMIDPRCLVIAHDYFEAHSRDVFATWIADASYEDRAVIGALIANGLRIEWRPELRVYHEDPADAPSAWRQKYRHGAGRIYRWREPPPFEFLLDRYFLGPIASGVAADYTIPAHIAFLLGYRDNYRRRNPGAPDWWAFFARSLCTAVDGAARWLPEVEATVGAAGAHAHNDVIVAGAGTVALDHVFVADGRGGYRYRGSRGGGSVWNILTRLAQSGARAVAHGVCASDGPGAQALAELRWLGVDTSGLGTTASARTPIFTQWLDDDIRHGPPAPQQHFTLECPICQRSPLDLAEFEPECVDVGDSALVCVDRLTDGTAALARAARRRGALAVLDLGGVAGLAVDRRPRLLEDLSSFDIVAMPGQVMSWLSEKPPQAFAHGLIASGVGAVAITHGRDGFDLFVRTQDGAIARRNSPAHAAEHIADATGAGDAFLAALIAEALDANVASRGNAGLCFRALALDGLIAVLKSAPVGVLGGVGARFGLDEHPAATEWGARVALLRGLGLKELRERLGTTRPCWFCDRA